MVSDHFSRPERLDEPFKPKPASNRGFGHADSAVRNEARPESDEREMHRRIERHERRPQHEIIRRIDSPGHEGVPIRRAVLTPSHPTRRRETMSGLPIHEEPRDGRCDLQFSRVSRDEVVRHESSRQAMIRGSRLHAADHILRSANDAMPDRIRRSALQA
jgi:hypothetical protein